MYFFPVCYIYIGINVAIKTFLYSFGCLLTALAVFFWIIYAATSSKYVEYLALMPVEPHILKAIYACIAEEFCGIQFSLMINLYHFVGLIFTDMHSPSHCVLYNRAYFTGLIFAVIGNYPQKR